ncbi:MAG: hypothetical protein ACXWC7_16660 [Chitinophagaceae bacterium]
MQKTRYHESKIKHATFVFLFNKPHKNIPNRMNLSYNRWKKLFLFGLGLFLGTAFCMKWMESDFVAGGERFTIMGLEFFYPKEKLIGIFNGLDDRVRTILRYHLYFDFAFMAGVYPGITSLCMLAREKAESSWIKKILYTAAWLQLLAWAGDIIENYYLLSWIQNPVIGNELWLYHFIVGAKWIIAIAGVLLSIPFLFRRKK